MEMKCASSSNGRKLRNWPSVLGARRGLPCAHNATNHTPRNHHRARTTCTVCLEDHTEGAAGAVRSLVTIDVCINNAIT
jgi:hypothetical protein